MFFKRKNDNAIKKNNAIHLHHILNTELLLKQFILKKSFVWNEKNISILNADNKERASHYIGIHTEVGIFYMHDGISWIQKLTSIHVEHEDEDTQNWLLERALENMSPNAFLSPIIKLSFNHYVNTNKYKSLILQGFSNNILYADIDNWINLFKYRRFIRKNNTNIENINIVKNILLGKQNLQFKDYKKLVAGNIVLVDVINSFDIEGRTKINLGKFSILASYHNNNLIFQSWDSNMSDKPYVEGEGNSEEWQQDEASLENTEHYNYDEQQSNQEDGDISSEEYAQEQEYNAENATEQEHNYNESNEYSETENIEQNIIEDEAHPFDNVPINLVFNLGAIRMPIANIMQLQEGAVIELHKPTPAQVSIYANGRLIGSGDVVEIDGKIGVQITKIEN